MGAWVRWAAIGLGVLAVVGLAVLPGEVERRTQGAAPHPPHPVSAAAAARHRALLVVDWHTDTLLWQRSLLERSGRGHVDLPRLAAGNVALQVFTAVTKSPAGQNYERNSGASDRIRLLVMLQRWPPRTWSSLLERALHQSVRLHAAAARAPARLKVVRTAGDLERLLAQRRQLADAPRPVGALLGIEGAHALEGRLENLDVLYEAGFRMLGLHHFFDNELGGSLHGESGGGLSEFGRAVVRRAEERRMLVDLAHSSPAVVDDVLAMATRPVVVSHTGVAGTCPSRRNLSDAQMQRIAARGGLVAIGYWKGAVCDTSPAGVVRAIRHAIDLLGPDHVALGSDFDGGTTTSFDTSELAALTHVMLEQGFREDEIAQVMGGNSVRFLREQLPPT
jgi:microsomal dipeptidase-like Zn-dependent dipeptidase